MTTGRSGVAGCSSQWLGWAPGCENQTVVVVVILVVVIVVVAIIMAHIRVCEEAGSVQNGRRGKDTDFFGDGMRRKGKEGNIRDVEGSLRRLWGMRVSNARNDKEEKGSQTSTSSCYSTACPIRPSIVGRDESDARLALSVSSTVHFGHTP